MPTINPHRLAGRSALVTGASRGIGAAIASRLAAEGARVVVNYHENAEAAKAVVSAIRDAGGDAVAMQADVGSVSEVERLVRDAAAHFGGLDILVNNAGIGSGPLAFGKIDEARFDKVFSTNLKSVLFAVQAAAPLMTDNRAAVVNLGSLVTRQPGGPLYSASKGAIVTLTISLAKALAPRGIRVNAVAPGPIETDMLRANPPQGLQDVLRLTPLARFGRPKEIAAAVAFLASDDASFITGETIPVGGGFR